ncbi:MAG: DUF2277 domain-containing protein [Dehalococcoidia bacterium]|nr:DUF2277 domain-containing protein [Dehalococcoidia bacterium]
MCRSIKTLRSTDMPATDEDVRAAALQFVRKISGYRKPSLANADAFQSAVDEVAVASSKLLMALKPPAAAGIR